MSYILWNPALLDNPAFCALMAENPEYLGLWFRCLQIANAAQLDGQLTVFGGRQLTPKVLAQAHFRRSDPETLATAAGFLECAIENGLLEQDGDYLVVAWWSEFGKELSETREAWRQRKERQRQKARAIPPTNGVSRDGHAESQKTPEPNNQPSKQSKQVNQPNPSKKSSSSNRATSKAARAEPSATLNGCAVSPLPGLKADALARAEQAFQASLQDYRPP